LVVKEENEKEEIMKIVMVLYPCPDSEAGEETPAELLGCADKALGLREWIEDQGHELVTTTDTEGDDELYEHLQDAEVLIATPFWPVYATKEVFDQAPNLRLCVLAGVGSDNFDLAEARDRGITVAEQSGSNITSVAEHAVMQILVLVRNFIPAYEDVVNGGWSIGEIAAKSHDLENKTVGIVGMGRIGQKVAMRLKGFDVNMLYYDLAPIGSINEYVLGVRWADLDELVQESDVITIHIPLTPDTNELFNRERLFNMKQGAWLVNTARGQIVERDALVEALESGHLAGYAGDVWDVQPAPPDHPWRTMPNHAMTPHVSGTALEPQRRYAKGVRECLEAYFKGEKIRPEYLIVEGGEIVSPSYAAAFE
jgi:formate dehydrogenase